MNKPLSQKHNREFCIFVCIICFLTNMSQMPLLVESGLTRYVSIPLWVLFGLVVFIKNGKFYIEKVKLFILLILSFILYYLVGLFFNSNFGESDLPYPIFLSTFVLLVGILAGRLLEEEDIAHIINFYVWSGIIVCIDVYFRYISGNSLSGPFYLYSSKNSVSQILLTTWILILLFKIEGKYWKRGLYLLAFVGLSWTLISLKSRATLIAIPLVMIWIIMHGKFNKRARNILIIVLLIFTILMFNEEFYNFIVNDILFRGKETGTVNDMTSGRADEWATFARDFADNPFLGAGREKKESLVLTSLLEFGVLGGGMILALACYPFLWGMKNLNKKNKISLSFTAIALVYTINGIFEQLSPFGPGVKCYFLWFLMGILATRTEFHREHSNDKTVLDSRYIRRVK